MMSLSRGEMQSVVSPTSETFEKKEKYERAVCSAKEEDLEVTGVTNWMTDVWKL